MTLIERIEQAFIKSQKEKNEIELSALRMLKASLKNKSIELRKALDENEIVAMVQSEIKKRKDSIEAYRAGARQDLVDREEAELKILSRFLPAQLSDAEIKERVKAVVAALPEEEKKNFGKVMKQVMAELKGQAGGELVSRAVKEALAE